MHIQVSNDRKKCDARCILSRKWGRIERLTSAELGTNSQELVSFKGFEFSATLLLFKKSIYNGRYQISTQYGFTHVPYVSLFKQISTHFSYPLTFFLLTVALNVKFQIFYFCLLTVALSVNFQIFYFCLTWQLLSVLSFKFSTFASWQLLLVLSFKFSAFVCWQLLSVLSFKFSTFACWQLLSVLSFKFSTCCSTATQRTTVFAVKMIQYTICYHIPCCM